jgi:hypothetical protein
MPEQTKSFLNFMTIFIGHVHDTDLRAHLEHALATTKAVLEKDEHTLHQLVPPPPIQNRRI